MSLRSGRVLAGAAAVVVIGVVAWLATGFTGIGGGAPVPRFVDEAASAGVDHRYDGEFAYFVGGGVAVLDCDADGRPDLYLAGGERPAALYRNASPIGGALAFERVPSAPTDLTAVTGAYPLDVDADGHTDLAVLRNAAANVLLRGLGDCRFEDATSALGLDGGSAWTAAFSATWEPGETLPTLAFGSYLIPDAERRTIECDDSELVRPDGDRYGQPITLSPGYCTLSMLFSDWDRSGRRDLRVSNDRHYYRDGEEQLWRIEPGEAPRLYTADEGWQTVRIFGMGIASRDLTGDGRPEVYLTSQADNKLQTLVDPGSGEPRYADIALERGVTAHRPYEGDTTLPSTAWHAEFGDVNADGLADLFVAKGNVEAQVDHAMQDPSNLLIGQADGTFAEGAPEAGIMTFDRARGASLVDLNLDGLLDLVVVTRREPVQLWRNVGSGSAEDPAPMGHWIGLRLQQDGPNRDAIGAWIDVDDGERMTSIELTVGGGHAGGHLGWTHVGLGSATSAEVTVTWPDGETQGPMRVDADGFAIIERGASAPRPWSPEEDR
ncbi:MAG TPA: CRTAC1 family protein [Candidatus Limnocylindria bacterium]|nr:CRTAC1 family protein [Candidatus Limnocylindria bacterium]